MGIASLGAVAGGFADGIERGQRIDANNMRIQRERKQMQREDDEMAALDAANAAARDVLKRYEGDWKQQQPGPTLGGGPVQANPFKPTPLMILEAGSARTNKLLELKGPTQAWGQSWSQDEAMRSRVRGDAAQRVRQAMTMGGDLTEPLSEFYSTTIGAGRVTQAGMTRGPDGKPVVSIALEGQPQPVVLPADQFLAEMDKTAANPADIAKHNLQMTLEAFKQRGSIEEIDARGKRDVSTAKEKHTLTLEEIDRRNQGDKDVANIRAGDSRSSARAEAIRALGQERTSVDNDIRTLTQQLKDARPTDRSLIQQQLSEARGRADDIRRRLAELSAGEGGGTVVQESQMSAVMRDAERQGLSDFDVQIGGQPRMSVRRGGATPAAAPQPMPKTKAELKPGAIYQTSRGPAKWNGTAFEAQ